MPDVRSSVALSGMVTYPRLNTNAPPNLPAVVRVTPLPSAPVFPTPDASMALLPLVSSNPYAATRPAVGAGDGDGDGDDTVTVNVCEAVFPAPSRAVTVMTLLTPARSGTLLTVQLVVPVATPDPPALFDQDTSFKATLSAAVPAIDS